VGEFSKQEIRKVIWNCDISGKVQDQMDIISIFNFFFQKYIKKDVVVAIEDFAYFEKLLKGSNPTFITLIP